jgi:hypothetical protein
MSTAEFKEQQVIRDVKEVRIGGKIGDPISQYGVSGTTIRSTKSRYDGLVVSGALFLPELLSKNEKPQRVLAKMFLDRRSRKNGRNVSFSAGMGHELFEDIPFRRREHNRTEIAV